MSYKVVKVDNKFYRVMKNNRLITNAANFLHQVQLGGLSTHTVRAYAYALMSVFKWIELKKIKIKNIKVGDLYRFIEFLTSKNSSPKTINHRLVVLRMYYRFLYGKDLPSGQYALATDSFFNGAPTKSSNGFYSYTKNKKDITVKTPTLVIEPLQAEEVKNFISSIPNYRMLSIVFLMLHCGLRCREIIHLKTQDIDFENMKLLIRGKRKKQRTVPATAEVLTTLTNYFHYERPDDSKSVRFFLSFKGRKRGHPMSYQGLRSLFRYRRTLSSTDKANPHRFRHTFGSNMAKNGVNLPILQALMGHASGKTTLQYINLSMADIHEAYEKASANIKRIYAKT